MLRYYRVSSGIQNLDPSLLGQINIRWNPTLSVRRLGKPQIFFRDWAIFVPIPKFGLFFVIRSLVRVHCEASHAPPPSKISESGSNCSAERCQRRSTAFAKAIRVRPGYALGYFIFSKCGICFENPINFFPNLPKRIHKELIRLS